MFLVYFDEVKYEEGKQPYYWICGIAATPEIVQRLEKAVTDLSRKCFRDGTSSRHTEFHASHIFHKKGNFRSFDLEKRISIIVALADILDSESELAKICARIEPAHIKYPDKVDVENMAFMYFVEQVERHLDSQESHGMLIGDLENEKVSKKFAKALSRYREEGTDYQFSMKLNYLIDTVHFTKSHYSRMLQLADSYVWLLQLCTNQDPNRVPHQQVISHVQGKTSLLPPTKSKHWPTKYSWHNY